MLNVRRINMSNTGPCSMFRALRDSSIILLVVTLIAVSVSLMGCTEDEFAKNSYTTLESARIVYDTAMSAAADMRISNEITEAEWNKLIANTTAFQTAGLVASTLVAKYVSCQDKDPNSSETAVAKEMAVRMLEALRKDYDVLLPQLISLGVSNRLPVLE